MIAHCRSAHSSPGLSFQRLDVEAKDCQVREWIAKNVAPHFLDLDHPWSWSSPHFSWSRDTIRRPSALASVAPTPSSPPSPASTGSPTSRLLSTSSTGSSRKAEPHSTIQPLFRSSVQTVQSANCTVCKLYSVQIVQCANCTVYRLFSVQTVYSVHTLQCTNYCLALYKLSNVQTVRCTNCTVYKLYKLSIEPTKLWIRQQNFGQQDYTTFIISNYSPTDLWNLPQS